MKDPFRPVVVEPSYERQLQQISASCKEAGLDCVFITQPNGYKAQAGDVIRRIFWMTPANETYTLDMDSMIHIAIFP